MVIATGPFQRPSIPQSSVDIPQSIFQVHSSNYRSPDQLPLGAVLMSAQALRAVKLPTNLMNAEGESIFQWASTAGTATVSWERLRLVATWTLGRRDRRADSLPSPQRKSAPVPLLTGVNGGYDVDLRRMASQG